jgi:hypothetical protein
MESCCIQQVLLASLLWGIPSPPSMAGMIGRLLYPTGIHLHGFWGSEPWFSLLLKFLTTEPRTEMLPTPQLRTFKNSLKTRRKIPAHTLDSCIRFGEIFWIIKVLSGTYLFFFFFFFFWWAENAKNRTTSAITCQIYFSQIWMKDKRKRVSVSTESIIDGCVLSLERFPIPIPWANQG